MPERAALITGGSSGIGFAIARMLGKDLGYAVTVNGRRPDKLEEAVGRLKDEDIEALAAPGNMADEEAIKQVVGQHRDAYGRMDVLINNAGIGVGSSIEEAATKGLDLQLGVNLRGVYLILRESIPMLKEAGHEHRKALVVNMASIAGKFGQAWLSMYSATKFGVVGLSQAAHRELVGDGIQVTALCPGFVDTAMTEWTAGNVPKDQMMTPDDIAAAVRFLLSTSPACIVPEIQFIRPGDTM